MAYRPCLRASSRALSSTSFKTVIDQKAHAEPHAQPHAQPVHSAHLAHGTTAVRKYHLKPGVRLDQLLMKGRELMPKLVSSAPGVWGLPGPRSMFFENQDHEFTSIGLWESEEAMAAYEKSKDHEILMRDLGAFMNFGEVKGEVHQADFHYWSPMGECNWERFPVVVSEWNVKPGFRQQCHKLVNDSKAVAAYAQNHGLLFQILIYNAVESHVVAYAVYRDLLKWESAQHDMQKHMADWGLAEFIVVDEKQHKAKQHQTPGHIHHHDCGTIHTNAWVYSE